MHNFIHINAKSFLNLDTEIKIIAITKSWKKVIAIDEN